MLATQLLSSAQLEVAAAILMNGGLVVLPTDTVYGVAALARNETAVAAIYRAKQRPASSALPVMVATAGQVDAIARPVPGFFQMAKAFWPGPLTLILPSRNTLPALVTAGQATVALRIPDHPLLLQLLRLVAVPLAVTSANLSGQPPARTAQEARTQLDGQVHAILDGGPAPGGQPSTILDLTPVRPRILRPGPITATQISSILPSQTAFQR
jgi:L-threonylcarbamoyladenylate synthase